MHSAWNNIGAWCDVRTRTRLRYCGKQFLLLPQVYRGDIFLRTNKKQSNTWHSSCLVRKTREEVEALEVIALQGQRVKMSHRVVSVPTEPCHSHGNENDLTLYFDCSIQHSFDLQTMEHVWMDVAAALRLRCVSASQHITTSTFLEWEEW